MAPYNSRTKLLLWSALSVAANAKQTLEGVIATGASVPDKHYDNSTTDRLVIAQQNPNATREITFKPFEAVGDTSSENLADIEWTWRVNVSDFATPDIRDASDVVDPHLISTSYDFSWSGSLPAALDNAWSGLCVTISDATDMPANVTNTFTYDGADDGSASCAAALGQACVDAILADVMAPLATENGTECVSPGTNWSELDECRDTLGYNRAANGQFSLSTVSMNFYTNSSANSTRVGPESGEGLYGHFSGAQNGSTAAAAAQYYSAANRLQIMLVNPMLLVGNGSGGGDTGTYGTGPGLYCMRVNATELSTKDVDGDGVAYTSEVVLLSADSSAAARSTGALSVLLATLCAMFVAA